MCISQELKSNQICFHFKMKFLFSVLLLLASGLPNPGNCNDLQCFTSGECTNSQELEILLSEDEFECLDSCQQNTNCTWFSFFPNSNVCHLLSSCGRVEDTFCPNCISGQKECDNPVPVCFAPGNVFLDN
jgi:hypothetical protein